MEETRDSLYPVTGDPFITVVIGVLGFCSFLHFHSELRQGLWHPGCHTSHCFTGMSKAGPHLWRSSESSKRQRRQADTKKKRVATIQALPESSKQILCVPGKHHVVFLFPMVSSYRFSQRLFSHMTPRWKLQQKRSCRWRFWTVRAPIAFCILPGREWGGKAHGGTWSCPWIAVKPGGGCCGGLVIYFGLEKSIIRKVNPVSCQLGGLLLRRQIPEDEESFVVF